MKVRQFIASAPAKWTIRCTAIVVVVLCALVLVPANRDHPIQFPMVVMDRITVTDNKSHITSNITDPNEVQKIVAFVNTRTSGWRKPDYTFPTPRYSVIFESGGQSQYILWIGADGANWIGCQRGGASGAENVLKDISPAERSELLADLGI